MTQHYHYADCARAIPAEVTEFAASLSHSRFAGLLGIRGSESVPISPQLHAITDGQTFRAFWNLTAGEDDARRKIKLWLADRSFFWNAVTDTSDTLGVWVTMFVTCRLVRHFNPNAKVGHTMFPSNQSVGADFDLKYPTPSIWLNYFCDHVSSKTADHAQIRFRSQMHDDFWQVAEHGVN